MHTKPVAIKRVGEFEWDEAKAKVNKRQHGVTFEEAITAFFDEHRLLSHDPRHHEEDRYILIGMSGKTRLLFVVHAQTIDAKRTRIISARKASKHQALRYAFGEDT